MVMVYLPTLRKEGHQANKDSDVTDVADQDTVC